MITEINYSAGIGNVKKIIIISSGKGGVGKSTFATHLAMSLWRSNYSVGILDIDLGGPSIPRMLGLANAKVSKFDNGWLPVQANIDSSPTDPKFVVMSIGFLLPNADTGVIWRGAKKNAMITSLLDQVYWGPLDFLVIDTPPGTSDEKITLATIMHNQHLSRFGGTVCVTTPQRVALVDVTKDISFYRKVGLPLVGLVENMSGLCCPRCNNVDRVFSSGGGQALAVARNVPFLGCVPLQPDIAARLDSAESFTEKWNCPVDEAIAAVAQQLVLAVQ